MVTDFLQENSIPYAGCDATTFWSLSEKDAVSADARGDGKIYNTNSPFGKMYTMDFSHLKGRFARVERHKYNQKISSRNGAEIFAKAPGGRWIRISIEHQGLVLKEMIKTW